MIEELTKVQGFSLHYRGCVICGAWKTDLHHIVKRKLGGVETIELCRRHHALAENGRISRDTLWRFLRDRSIGHELADDFGMEWEMSYHRDVMMYAETRFHDFYSDEYGVCLFPPALHAGDRGIYRQCMVSLWLNGKRELELA